VTSPSITPDGVAPAASDGAPAWEPRGHVVRWAAVALALTIAVLVVSIDFGLLAPRVSAFASTTGPVAGTDDHAYVQITVTNEARGAITVFGPNEAPPGLDLVATSVTRGDTAITPALPTVAEAPSEQSLHQGQTATVTAVWRVTDCDLVPRDDSGIPVEVRTPLGLRRAVEVWVHSGLEPSPTWGRQIARAICGEDPR
jgi:hypothetical protein